MAQKIDRVTDKKHLKFIRSLPCAGCFSSHSQAAHIRKGTDGGTSLKPSDCFTVPLCHSCHIGEQHRVGEVTFWVELGGVEKATALALRLYEVTGDVEKGTREVIRFRCSL